MKDSIIVYSSPSCPKCKILKMELTRRGVEFEDCQDTDKIAAMGIQSVPMLSINGELFGMADAIRGIKEGKICK